MIYIQNCTLFTPSQRFEDGAALIDGDQIAAAGYRRSIPCPNGTRTVDAAGGYLAPGFIDLQFNGGFGLDFTEQPGTIWEAGANLPRYGVTAFLPTIVTSPLATVARAQQVLLQGPPAGYKGAWPIGLHVEGPFLNPARRGAHNPAYLQKPDLAAVEDWLPQRGVRLATLAPELPGARELIQFLAGRGVVVSAGHSIASYEEARAAFDAGVRYGTHLFNAMPPLDHRNPGLTGALLDDPGLTIGIIPDGVHVHPALVSLAWKAAPDRINPVTDAMTALGMPPGRYQIGGLEVIVDENSARLADGRLAGSLLSLDQALRNTIQFTGCSLQEALASITSLPSRLLGLEHQFGSIAAGRRADLVVLNRDLGVTTTFVAGQQLSTDFENGLHGFSKGHQR